MRKRDYQGRRLTCTRNGIRFSDVGYIRRQKVEIKERSISLSTVFGDDSNEDEMIENVLYELYKTSEVDEDIANKIKKRIMDWKKSSTTLSILVFDLVDKKYFETLSRTSPHGSKGLYLIEYSKIERIMAFKGYGYNYSHTFFDEIYEGRRYELEEIIPKNNEIGIIFDSNLPLEEQRQLKIKLMREVKNRLKEMG